LSDLRATYTACRQSSRAKLDCIVSMAGAVVHLTRVLNTSHDRHSLPFTKAFISTFMIAIYSYNIVALALRRAPLPAGGDGLRCPPVAFPSTRPLPS
jgi:hypothetical protein